MRVLQSRFVEVLQDQLKQDQQMAELQTQLQGSRKEVEAGGCAERLISRQGHTSSAAVVTAALCSPMSAIRGCPRHPICSCMQCNSMMRCLPLTGVLHLWLSWRRVCRLLAGN